MQIMQFLKEVLCRPCIRDVTYRYRMLQFKMQLHYGTNKSIQHKN